MGVCVKCAAQVEKFKEFVNAEQEVVCLTCYAKEFEQMFQSALKVTRLKT